jgi:hypothetical protein
MSYQNKRPLPEDAERLFQRMVQLVEKEGAGYQDWHPLTHEFLENLGFRTPETVEKATLQIRLYAHQDGWCHPAMYVEDNKLFCAPDVARSWDAYCRHLGTGNSAPK